MPALITAPRAAQQIPGYDPSDEATLASIISACSACVESYCRRVFTATTYDHFIDGTGSNWLLLPNPPIRKVWYCRGGAIAAMYVQNNDQDVSFASVNVLTNGLELVRTKDAITTTTTLLWSDYPLVNQLTPAVNNLGNGWHATTNGVYGKWPSSDLIPFQGAQGVRLQTSPLELHWQTLNQFDVYPADGLIYLPVGWQYGSQNYRVKYDGGFLSIPEDLQQAVSELVQATYQSRNLNSNLQSETLDKYSYAKAATNSLSNLSWTAKATLDQYRLIEVPRWT